MYRPKIVVLVKEPFKEPEVRTIHNDGDEIRKILGGYIEPVTVKKGVLILCDEEGKVEGKQHNFFVRVGNEIVDEIVGTAIICGEDEEDFAGIPADRCMDIYDELLHGAMEVDFS